MIRNSLAGWTVGVLICLAATVVIARQPSAAELYGRGVSAYFGGDAQQAITLLSKAIKLNPNDPRAYFFRGLAHERQGDLKAAKTDFAKGSEIDATAKTHVYDVDDALQRIQGSIRIEIENQRRAACKAALERRRKQEQVRYEQLKRREADVLFDPKRPLPKIDFQLPKLSLKVDPFASGLALSGGKQVSVKAAPAIALPTPTTTSKNAKPRDPFAAPTSGAAAKPANPLGSAGALPPPKAPKPQPEANPFGDLKPATKAPATKGTAPQTKPATDPFGIGAAKPAASKPAASNAGAADKKKTAAPTDPFGGTPAKVAGSTKKKEGAAGATSKPPAKKPAKPAADDPFK